MFAERSRPMALAIRFDRSRHDPRRATWVLPNVALQRVRLFVDYLCAAHGERRAEVIGR